MIQQDRHTDQLQRPKHFPEPVVQYTLKEMSVIWHMYGGRDFQPSDLSSPASSPTSSPRMSAKEPPQLQSPAGQPSVTHDHFYSGRTRPSGSGGITTTGRTRTSDFVSTLPSPRQPSLSPRTSGGGGVGGRSHGGGVGGSKKQPGRRQPSDWRVAGGPGRDHSVLMELELDKVHVIVQCASCVPTYRHVCTYM